MIDTPPVSAADPDGIAALGRLLAAVRPDETHLITPAGYDARRLPASERRPRRDVPGQSHPHLAPRRGALGRGRGRRLAPAEASRLLPVRQPQADRRAAPRRAGRAGVAGDALMADSNPPLVGLTDHPRAAHRSARSRPGAVCSASPSWSPIATRANAAARRAAARGDRRRRRADACLVGGGRAVAAPARRRGRAAVRAARENGVRAAERATRSTSEPNG